MFIWGTWKTTIFAITSTPTKQWAPTLTIGPSLVFSAPIEKGWGVQSSSARLKLQCDVYLSLSQSQLSQLNQLPSQLIISKSSTTVTSPLSLSSSVTGHVTSHFRGCHFQAIDVTIVKLSLDCHCQVCYLCQVNLLLLHLLSTDCTPAAKIFRKLSSHLRKWERCDLGGKHRARYCHLLLAPPFRLTPNEAKGGSP